MARTTYKSGHIITTESGSNTEYEVVSSPFALHTVLRKSCVPRGSSTGETWLKKRVDCFDLRQSLDVFFIASGEAYTPDLDEERFITLPLAASSSQAFVPSVDVEGIIPLSLAASSSEAYPPTLTYDQPLELLLAASSSEAYPPNVTYEQSLELLLAASSSEAYPPTSDVQGINEYSLQFDDANVSPNRQGLLCSGSDPTVLMPTDAISISAWYRRLNLSSSYETKIVNFGGEDAVYEIVDDSGVFKFRSILTSSFIGIYQREETSYVPYNATYGEWTHLVGTWDTSTQLHHFYINGYMVMGSSGWGLLYYSTPPWASAPNNSQFNVGRFTGSAGTGTLGNIDEVAVWNRRLSDGEVTDIYNAGCPVELTSSLNRVGYWRMGDPSGSSMYPTIPDEDGNNDGVMQNMSASQIVPCVPCSPCDLSLPVPFVSSSQAYSPSVTYEQSLELLLAAYSAEAYPLTVASSEPSYELLLAAYSAEAYPPTIKYGQSLELLLAEYSAEAYPPTATTSSVPSNNLHLAAYSSEAYPPTLIYGQSLELLLAQYSAEAYPPSVLYNQELGLLGYWYSAEAYPPAIASPPAPGTDRIKMGAMSSDPSVHAAKIIAGPLVIKMGSMSSDPSVHGVKIIGGAMVIKMGSMSSDPSVHAAKIIVH